MLDMLMTRYDITYFMTLPLKIGYRLITTAYYEIEKQKAWDLWIARQSMDAFQPFSKFFNNILPEDMNKDTHKSAVDILKESKSIESMIAQGRFKEVKM